MRSWEMSSNSFYAVRMAVLVTAATIRSLRNLRLSWRFWFEDTELLAIPRPSQTTKVNEIRRRLSSSESRTRLLWYSHQ